MDRRQRLLDLTNIPQLLKFIKNESEIIQIYNLLQLFFEQQPGIAFELLNKSLTKQPRTIVDYHLIYKILRSGSYPQKSNLDFASSPGSTVHGLKESGIARKIF